jgi:hypothetical protein
MPIAAQLLDIYRTRVQMAEQGVTHPLPAVLEASRALVAALEKVPPESACLLSHELVGRHHSTVFRVNDEVIAVIPHPSAFDSEEPEGAG